MMITNRLLIAFLVFTLTSPAKPQTSDTWAGNVILGRPTDRSITASVFFPNDQDAVYLEYGDTAGSFSKQTPVRKGVSANTPCEEVMGGLKPDQRYRSGDILPNSGHLRVTVSLESVKVDYVRAYLPKDETADRKNGEIAFSYTISPRNQKPK